MSIFVLSLCLSAVGFYTVETDTSGVSAFVRPDGTPEYLSGVEHLFKQEAHEFANTNWENGVVAHLKACGVPELWCYHVSEREQPATNYRLYPWQNMRDGMRPWCQYWHNDECTGFSFRAKHAYASCYIDFDTDTLSLSRRQLAADLAYEEGKLVDYLKRKFRDDPAKLARIDALVRTAADAGTMKAMDAARAALMEML